MTDLAALRRRADTAQRAYQNDLARIEHVKTQLTDATEALHALGATNIADAESLAATLQAHIDIETHKIAALLDSTDA
jgi:hypothetical protein